MPEHENAPLLRLLESWKRELAEAQRVVDERKIAIFHLERTLSGASQPMPPTYQRPPKRRRASLAAAIRDVIREMPADTEFWVATIHDALTERSFQITSDQPRTRISSALDRLLSLGGIERTFEGSGNVPHRYKRAKEFDAMFPEHDDDGGDDA